MTRYATPPGGLPPQSKTLDERAVFTESYAFIPADTMRDIVTSFLPHWKNTRAWIIARPMTGFSETFSHYITEVGPGGGSTRPDDNPNAQSVLFVVAGAAEITLMGQAHSLTAGSYVYIPAGADWTFRNISNVPATFHWIRKAYQAADGVALPQPFITHDDNATVIEMPETDGKWSTSRFVEPEDLRHDMHVNIVNFLPDGCIPFMETHVMEHGLYVLEGTAKYRLNQDWVEVGPGDYMWLRAFCPQACVATGDGPFRYLLYKDVNRHMPLDLCP